MNSFLSEQITATIDRRAFPRIQVCTRSAVWLDEGPQHGIIGTLSDLSMGGFATRLLASPHDELTPGATLYCALLVQGAHLDCLATIRSSLLLKSGESQLGFSIDTLSTDSSRLLRGVLRYFEAGPEHSAETTLFDIGYRESPSVN